MASGNPFLREKRFRELNDGAIVEGGAMTMAGAMNKTGILFLLLLIGASLTWVTPGWDGATPSAIALGIGAIGGFILALVTSFNMSIARLTAPAYAFFEGLFLGGLSSMLEARYTGIVFQAMVVTLTIFAGMYITYRSGLVVVSARFRNAVIGATIGIALFYLLAMILGIFGVNIPMLFAGGTVGLIFSGVVIVIASMNLMLDFDMIATLARRGAPKYIEWYGAFSLMVTLVWLYVEILRMLARMKSRN